MSKRQSARTEASSDEEARAEGSAIMSNASTEASSDEQDDSFSPLMHRLESAIHHLKLIAVDLGGLAVEMPNTEEHGSAAFVVREVTRDLNQLYRSFEAWEETHNYTPRDMQPLMEHLRQIGADDDARDRMLHGRTVLSPSCI